MYVTLTECRCKNQYPDHIPFLGARLNIRKGSSRYWVFQSTCPLGARLSPVMLLNAPDYFNPRARLGHDQRYREDQWYGDYFNPRARLGHDVRYRPSISILVISIHVPAWGTTRLDVQS